MSTNTYTHVISDERWGETCLVDDVDMFVDMMQESMFPHDVVAQKLAELREIASERDEECEETYESLVEGWRDDVRDAMQDVEEVTLADGRTGWMTSGGAVYVETANGLATCVGEWDDIKPAVDTDDYRLYCSDRAEPVTSDELGLEHCEYDALIRESLQASTAEGHVKTSTGIRVYAQS